MRSLVFAALTAISLASCGAPAYAVQSGCMSLEAVLPDLDAVKDAGFRVVTMHGAEANAALAAVFDAVGPAPRKVELSAVIIVYGNKAAMILLVEGDSICLRLPVSLSAAELIERAVRGRPV